MSTLRERWTTVLDLPDGSDALSIIDWRDKLLYALGLEKYGEGSPWTPEKVLEQKQMIARARGLDEDSTWAEIFPFDDWRMWHLDATELGFQSSDGTWPEYKAEVALKLNADGVDMSDIRKAVRQKAEELNFLSDRANYLVPVELAEILAEEETTAAATGKLAN
jgi:hypothetical protein